MGPKKATKEEIKNIDKDENTIVFWLSKIYDKIESIEINQKVTNEIMQTKIDSLDKKIENIITLNLNNTSPVNNSLITSSGYEDGTNSEERELYLLKPKINIRKLAFYNKIRSKGISEIYGNFLKQSPPFIPRKFRESRIPGESDQQRKRMEHLEITKLKMEIERLEEEYNKHQSTVEEIESEIRETISKSNDAVERQHKKEIWVRETNKEEGISNQIWDRKKKFFEDLPSREEEVGEEEKNSPTTTEPWKKNVYQKNMHNWKSETNYNHGRNSYKKHHHHQGINKNKYDMFESFIEWMNNNGERKNREETEHRQNFHRRETRSNNK